MVKIIIGGDVCPIGKNRPYFEDGDAKAIFNDLLPEFEDADLSLVNLESPLIDEGSPILKNGPVLGVSSKCINGLAKAGIDVVNLANNHILDHGSKGLQNTITTCRSAGIETVGAGKNLEEAKKMLIRNMGGLRIGILAFAEHEFSIATENSWGANPIDVMSYVRAINRNKGQFDYLIVLLHAGNEHYPYPSPWLRELCHFLVEIAANTVVVQHTHCPGSYEEYKNAHIFYGQGNLIFDYPSGYDSFFQGYVVEISLSKDLQSEVKLIAYQQSGTGVGASRLDQPECDLFLKSLKARSDSIRNPLFIEKQWLLFCEQKKHEYLSKVLGHNRLLRKLNSRGHLSRYLYHNGSLKAVENMVLCESHREVLKTIFSELNDLS